MRKLHAGGYLVASMKKQPWGELSVRYTSKAPALSAGEVAVKIDLYLPEGLFKRPSLEAKIEVPESAVSQPVISAEVMDNIQEVLKQQLGIDLKVSVVQEGEA